MINTKDNLDSKDDKNFGSSAVSTDAEPSKKQLTSNRIREALKAAKAMGVKLGRHGKKVLSKTNRVAADLFAKNMVNIIKELHAEGYIDIRSITEELNRRRIPTFRGKGRRWHLRTVNLLLKRIAPESLKRKLQPVKWVGGKRSILTELRKYLPKEFNNYWEPFVGGGALFFDLYPKIRKAYLSDTNKDLVTMYQVIKSNPDDLIEVLKIHSKKHDEEYYYSIRDKNKLEAPVEVAARMLYLNKTCYNGLWRVNKKGEFNASIGNYSKPVIYNAANIKACNKALRCAKLKQADFKSIKPQAGDFVYFDPPYHRLNDTSFTAYSKEDFTEKDHIRLARFCKKLHAKGVKLMVSNSKTAFIYNLYDLPIFNIHVIKAPRLVNSNSSERKPVEEFIITNY